jgi:hypothetical protein
LAITPTDFDEFRISNEYLDTLHDLLASEKMLQSLETPKVENDFVPDAIQMLEPAFVLDAIQTPDTDFVPNATQTPDTKIAPDTFQTPDTEIARDANQTTPFSSFLLRHANTFATRVTSLLQPSPGADAEEEHTIVFYEKEHVATKTLHPMTVLSPPHDEEQIIVFEMETIAPVCLFPLVPPSTASASVDEIASGGGLDELTPDAVPIVDADADSIAFGVDALLVPDTAHDDPLVHIRPFQKPSDDETIPLDPRFVFHNTVEMLPPATGPPHQVVGMDCFDHACWPVCDPHSCHSFSDHGENSANLLSSLAIEDHSRELDYDGEILGRLLFLIADDDPVYDVSTAESFED